MISLISIMLDIINYNSIRRDSLFLSLFTLLSIIFLKKDDKYLIKVFLIGILYDLLFTNYFILHGLIFLLFGIFIKKVNINKIIIGIIMIFFYQFILFIIYNISHINILNLKEFIFIFKHYIIINIIYLIIVTKSKVS